MKIIINCRIIIVISVCLFCFSTYGQDKVSGPVYTGNKIPGDINNGINHLKQVYKYIQIYRARHEGNYQDKRGMVLHDMLNNPQPYGFQNNEEVVVALSNPDVQYDDLSFMRINPQRRVASAILASRPNGAPIGSIKPQGTKDVLAYITTYYHKNPPRTGSEQDVANPIGFYLALYDDGTVAKIPYDEATSVYEIIDLNSNKLRLSLAFPDQAGVPYNTLSYEEDWKTYPISVALPISHRALLNGDKIIPDNGVFESLVQLSRLQSFPDRYGIDRQDLWQQFDPAQAEFTLAEAQAGAAKLKLPLQLRAISLDELQKLNAPAIILTNDDKRLVTISALDDSHAIVLDRGLTLIVPREALAKRYDGNALLPETAKQAAQVLAEDSVRAIDLKSLNDEVTQQVKINNRGTAPLTLQIERPISGATSAELSSETVAPGQSATLIVKMKWRDVLKTPMQNVVVTLRTDDPVRPRLPIGFLLRAPKP